MCDEHTEAEDRAWLSRRQVALGAPALAALAGCAPALRNPSAPPLVEQAVSIPTSAGRADAFFTYPAAGRHPAVLLWPDIAGLREAYREASRRLAAHGFAVLAVNHYYRSAPAPVLPDGVEWRSPEGRALIEPMGKLLTPAAYADDSRAYIGWLDQQRAVDTRRKIGSVGHCMTGQATLRAAAARPDRVGAAVSFHGGGLVTDKPDSPHLLIPATRASLLVAIAENDDAKEPTVKEVLRQAARAAGRPAEIEVYPARHGWTTLDSPVHDPVQAERAWTRARALFERL